VPTHVKWRLTGVDHLHMHRQLLGAGFALIVGLGASACATHVPTTTRAPAATNSQAHLGAAYRGACARGLVRDPDGGCECPAGLVYANDGEGWACDNPPPTLPPGPPDTYVPAMSGS
jgi:hypothetical protein